MKVDIGKDASWVQKFKITAVSWTFGMIAGISMAVLMLIGLVRVRDSDGSSGLDKNKLQEMMLKTGRGVLIISNHPTKSGWETVAIPALFWLKFLLSWKWMPVSTPKSELYNTLLFFIRPVCLPVKREDRKAGIAFINTTASLLKSGRIIVLFAEGGRTYKGKEGDFKWRGDKKIRRFQEGVRGILKRGSPIILMAWVEGRSIRFGEPFVHADEPLSVLEERLLDLS